MSETKLSHYRLYYEIVFARGDQSHRSVLLAADSAEEISKPSTELVNPEPICYPGAKHCAVFPEACSAAVEMTIVVNGKRQTAIWGAALRSVVTNPHSPLVRRLYKGQLTPVRVDLKDPKALLLPLLPGDQTRWS